MSTQASGLEQAVVKEGPVEESENEIALQYERPDWDVPHLRRFGEKPLSHELVWKAMVRPHPNVIHQKQGFNLFDLHLHSHTLPLFFLKLSELTLHEMRCHMSYESHNDFAYKRRMIKTSLVALGLVKMRHLPNPISTRRSLRVFFI